MFDVDTFETYIGGTALLAKHANNRAACKGGAVSSTALPPRSREERLRFYSERSAQVDVSEGTPEEMEAHALRKRGNDSFEAKDYEGAAELYSDALRLAPSSTLYSNRAAAYMTLGWWDQAFRDAKAATRRDAGNLRALERYVKILLALDRLDEVPPVVNQFQSAIANGTAAAPEITIASMKASVQRVQHLAERARSPAGLTELRSVLADFGDSLAHVASPLGERLRRRLVSVLVERSDTLYNSRHGSQTVRPYCERGQANGVCDEAEACAKEALSVTAALLKDHPEDADLRLLRARALVRLGRRAEAEGELAEGMRQAPEHGQTKALCERMSALEDCRTRGNAAFRSGIWEEAVRLYGEGLEQDVDCEDTRTVAALHYNRSAALRQLGEFEAALQDTNAALALQPRWTKALYRRAILLLECGRAAEALTEFKVVQRADPTFDAELETWLRRSHNALPRRAGQFNPYRAMRLPMDATNEDMRAQYKRLCLQWHPDKNPTDDGRRRFDELQAAYRVLLNDAQRLDYDLGNWKDRPVRHHVKERIRARDLDTQGADCEEFASTAPVGYKDKHLEEDDKVYSVRWGEAGCPEWMRERREEVNRQRYRACDFPDPT